MLAFTVSNSLNYEVDNKFFSSALLTIKMNDYYGDDDMEDENHI